MEKTAMTAVAILTVVFSQIKAQDTKETLQQFLKEIPTLETEKITSEQAINSVSSIANKNAAKTIAFTKDNIEEALKEAQPFKYGLVIVGEHTIVKIMDFKKCNVSGSWGTCMPYGEGYIKRGTLVSIKDYINNIIGKPDAQTRTLYLFN